jgi:hypothetical protein
MSRHRGNHKLVWKRFFELAPAAFGGMTPAAATQIGYLGGELRRMRNAADYEDVYDPLSLERDVRTAVGYSHRILHEYLPSLTPSS